MHGELALLAEGVAFCGDICTDAVVFLARHGCPRTAGHCACVAAEARRIAVRYNVDGEAAAVAGWLHDISAVVPNGERVALAEALGLELLPEERALPMIVHQRLSAVIARELFGVSDKGVLSAISCHTTLRSGASLLDTVVFVADKIAWDQPGDPPYLDRTIAALDRSLDEAAFCYIDYLWRQRDALPVIHPWLAAAHGELSVRAV